MCDVQTRCLCLYVRCGKVFCSHFSHRDEVALFKVRANLINQIKCQQRLNGTSFKDILQATSVFHVSEVAQVATHAEKKNSTVSTRRG